MKTTTKTPNPKKTSPKILSREKALDLSLKGRLKRKIATIKPKSPKAKPRSPPQQESGGITKAEMISMLELTKGNIRSIEKKIDRLRQENHPKLAKEAEQQLKYRKADILYMESRIKEMDHPPPSPSPVRSTPRNVSRYHIKIPHTLQNDQKIMETEGYGHNALRNRHYNALLRLAQSEGKGRAQDKAFQTIAQKGFVKTSADDYDLWSPLIQKGLVKEVDQSVGSMQGFFRKDRHGKYQNKGKSLSGFEPTSHSIGVYELTEKGWAKTDDIMKLKKKLTTA